jgi:hypothetical protein
VPRAFEVLSDGLGRAPASPTEVRSALRALLRPWVRTLLASPGSWPSFLPWGFQETAPPSFASLESTPTDVAAGFGPMPPGTVLVPPSWSLTTSTVCSSRALAGLLHPAPDHGVHRVSASAPCSAPAVACAAGVGLVPPHRCSTLQSFPRSCSRTRVTAGLSLLAVHQLAMLARPRGVAPHERPLLPEVLPHPPARCSLGLPFLKHACRLSCPLGLPLARPPCGPSTCSHRPLPDPAPEGTGSEVVAPTRPRLAPVCSTRGWCLRTRGLLRIRPVSVSPRCARDLVARSPRQTAIMFRLPLQHPRGDASHSDLA